MDKPRIGRKQLVTLSDNALETKKSKLATSKLSADDAKLVLSNIERTVSQLHQSVLVVAVALLVAMVEAGRLLLAAKKLKPHGAFTSWREEALPAISERTCQRYMAIAEFVDKNMDDIRSKLKVSQPQLNVDALSDEQTLANFEVAEITRWMHQETRTSKQMKTPIHYGPPRLSPGIAHAINAVASEQKLVVSDFELDTDPLTTCRRESCDAFMKLPPDVVHFAFAILTSEKDIHRVVRMLHGRFLIGTVLEAMVVLPLNANSAEFADESLSLPQLMFRDPKEVILTAQNQPANFPPMTALLFTRPQSRHEDFANAFLGCGSLKIPFRY